MSNIKQKVILKLKNDDFTNQLQELLVQAGKVKVSGLGIFEIKRINEREGYGVYEKKMITIPAHNKLVFRMSKTLRRAIQEHGK